jgi:hypothetical protein
LTSNSPEKSQSYAIDGQGKVKECLKGGIQGGGVKALTEHLNVEVGWLGEAGHGGSAARLVGAGGGREGRMVGPA